MKRVYMGLFFSPKKKKKYKSLVPECCTYGYGGWSAAAVGRLYAYDARDVTGRSKIAPYFRRRRQSSDSVFGGVVRCGVEGWGRGRGRYTVTR